MEWLPTARTLSGPARAWLLVWLCALLATACPPVVDRSRLPEPGPSRPWTPPTPASWSLPNGLRVWHLPLHHTPLVSLRLVLPRGGASDPPGKDGLTLMLLDMLDEGAAGRSGLAINDELRRLAVDYDAHAGMDSATLEMDTVADSFPRALEVLADLVLRPELPRPRFDARLRQRLAWALESEASPERARGNALRRALFGSGYASVNPRGVRRTLAQLRYEDVREHRRAVIAPAGATLIVVGALPAQRLRELVDAAFGKWSGQPTGGRAELDPEPAEPGVHLVDLPGKSQATVAVARRVSGVDAADVFATAVVNRLFGGTFSGRLNMNLREINGYTYAAGSAVVRWRASGFFTVLTALARDDAAAGLEEVLSELADLAEDVPISADELKRAKTGMVASLPSRFERIADIADELAKVAARGRPPDWLARWPRRVAAVTLSQARAAAERLAVAERFTIVVVGDRAILEPALRSLDRPITQRDAQGYPAP